MLSIKQPELLREAFAQAVVEKNTIEACWFLGQQADTPSTAFFIAYQAAIRCLDPNLASTEWGAFCVSEKGIRSPFLMNTEYSPTLNQIKGAKSFVMLAGQGIDWFYVLAKKSQSEPTQLSVLKLNESDFLTQGSIVKENKQAPFMSDVPHYSVEFSLDLNANAVFLENAHETANKPFRYWEDAHLIIALAAWLQARLPEQDRQLIQAVQHFEEQFYVQPKGYSLETLDAFDSLLKIMLEKAKNLNAPFLAMWQRDAVLLKLTAPLRIKIREKLSAQA